MAEGIRHDGRPADALRPVTLERGVSGHAEGSCLVTAGAPACSAPRRWSRGCRSGAGGAARAG
jgi:exosome complex RNA-binding protein Rrp42 (RNase PH superfamily)